MQSSGRSEVTGANVLVAIFAERESNAAYFLQEQEMTRYDAVNFIAHGVAKILLLESKDQYKVPMKAEMILLRLEQSLKQKKRKCTGKILRRFKCKGNRWGY